MYFYQLISAVYEDFYGAGVIDANQLLYLAPAFIIILSIVYLIRIKIFDRIYGIDLSEIERENLSPFSPLSDKEYKEIKSFQEADSRPEDEIREDYYVKL